jgi:hypothetical protein
MNRIITDKDILLYGEYLKDDGSELLIDEPTKIFVNGVKECSYYFMTGRSNEFPSLKGKDITIWVDFDILGFSSLKFQNDVKELPWARSVKFRGIPGTTSKLTSFVCLGTDYIGFPKDELKPCVTKWPKGRKYMSGGFSFRVIQSLKTGHGFDLSVQDQGEMDLYGLESQFGFTGLRIQKNAKKAVVSRLHIEECYIHDTQGEPFYIGSTKYPTAKFKNVTQKNIAIARAGGEAIQDQHFCGSQVSDITIHHCGIDWLNSFQRYQDTGIQFKAGEGINELSRILIDGYTTGALMPFGSDPTEWMPEIFNETRFKDILAINGRGNGMYFNKDCSNGVHWILDNVMFGKIDNSYYEHTGEPIINSIVSSHFNRADKVIIKKLVHDGSKTTVLFYPETYIVEPGAIALRAFSHPEYVNSGFLPGEKVSIWHRFYANYFPGPDFTPTHWEPHELAIDKDLVADTYELYYCIKEHDSTELRPSINPECFILLTYDLNGIRSDQPGWNPADVQNNIGPDDLRQTKDSPYRDLGFKEAPKTMEELKSEIIEMTGEIVSLTQTVTELAVKVRDTKVGMQELIIRL